MPELPEVETVVRDLRPLLVGRTVLSVTPGPAALRRPWAPPWSAAVVGGAFDSLTRRGKWIVAAVGGLRLLIHLGMTGQLRVFPAGEPAADHTHMTFGLDGGELRFRDPRRFGSVTLFETADSLNDFLNERLGPEPFDLKPAGWRDSLKNTKRKLKAVLLDQKIVAGVGNIYADEALFVAGLHPETRADVVTPQQADRLRLAVARVLKRAIERRGSSVRDYVDGSGQFGGYQSEHRVYGRTGEACVECRTAVERIVVGGRSSHFCPACQPGAV